MRGIKHIHDALSNPIADLTTYTALPNRSTDHIDPFLFLNHHGPQVYSPQNGGLPFGPHPHRGIETVTFILEGDIMHRDNKGFSSVIGAGGIQWMTAGSGLIHAETSSSSFRQHGGPLEILQLWLNLPSRLKMTPPKYTGLQADDIPSFALNDGLVGVKLISGHWDEREGAFDSMTRVHLSLISFKPEAQLKVFVPTTRNVFFYVIRGQLRVNGQVARSRQLVEFHTNEEELHIEAPADALLLFGHGEPFHEPIVAQGPFVMNSHAEIMQAYRDYQEGRFGSWNE